MSTPPTPHAPPPPTAAAPSTPPPPPLDADPTVRPDWLGRDRWPHPIGTVDVGRHRVAVTDTGGSGPALLLVHAGFWSFVWRDVLADLAPTFRCVTLDAPGAGLTGGPDDVGLDDVAGAVSAVVTRLDLHAVTLVVHDLGGPATLAAASAWPERVEGLVAVNTFGWRPSGAAFRGMLATMGSAPVRWSDATTGWLPRLSATRFGVGRRWDAADRRTFHWGLPRPARRAFHRLMASARTFDFSTVEASVGALADRPLLTVFGERNDPLGFQPRWAERFGDLTAVQVPTGYHFPMCDDPALVAGAIAAWHRDRVRPRRG